MNLREIAELTHSEKEQFNVNRTYIESWLKRMGVGNFTIDPNTNVVDVRGSVDLSGRSFNAIAVQFGHVSGSFFLSRNSKLRSLRGCPHTVGDSLQFFSCPSITSLDGVTKTIGKDLFFDDTPNLKSLSGIEKFISEIRGGIFCSTHVTHVLGILLIKKLQTIDIDSHGPIDEIMNKYIGTGDILSCQDELIDAGFVEQARL